MWIYKSMHLNSELCINVAINKKSDNYSESFQTKRYWPIDMMNMWTDSERVHPVPESSLLPGLTFRETKRESGKPHRHRTRRFWLVKKATSYMHGHGWRSVGQRNYSSMLTLQIPLLVLWFGESRVFVEERCHKGHVELCISTHDICSSYELSAAEAISLNEHTLGSLREILLLVAHIVQ